MNSGSGERRFSARSHRTAALQSSNAQLLRAAIQLTFANEDKDEQVRAAAVRRVKSLVRAFGRSRRRRQNRQRSERAFAGTGNRALRRRQSRDGFDADAGLRFFRGARDAVARRKGRDGNACVDCHATHALLKLNPPDKTGRFAEAQLRKTWLPQ